MTARQPFSLADVEPSWAWAPFEPQPGLPWDLAAASHLYRRAGLGANWQQLQQAIQEPPGAAVEALVRGGAEHPQFEQEIAEAAQPLLGGSSIDSLAAWWLYAMLHSPHPLHERMTLFWHGHFATSFAKVGSVELMYRQHGIFRRHALGHFAPLLREIARDPAMLLWLDSATNRKRQPNENFAREVMELFCLGLDQYSEADIREAARAFTGWEVRQKRFSFNPQEHDSGKKTVLGRSGNWNGDDVLAILLEHPATARFLTGKLFRHFISEAVQPPARLLEPLAAEYRRRDYDTAWLLQTMLGANLFFSPLARRQKIKGPVELAVGLLRTLQGTTNSYRLARDVAELGQALFQPPTVKGWNGGREWLHSASVLGRLNLVWALVSGTDRQYANKLDVVDVLARQGVQGTSEAVVRLSQLLLGETPQPAWHVKLAAAAGGDGGQSSDTSLRSDARLRSEDDSLRYARVVQAIAALPEFQLA